MNQYGLLGENISYSLSPQIHNTIYKIVKIEEGYDLLDVSKERFDQAYLDQLLGTKKGLNVTIPHKQSVMSLIGPMDDVAQKIGAVNTLVNREGVWWGYNTDYFGFMKTVLALQIKTFDRAIILGTGGAAKAVYHALKDLGFKDLIVVARQEGKSFEDHKSISYERLEKEQMASDLLVNCTPVGMKGELPCSESVIRKQGHVIDLIYKPSETPLLKVSSAYGIPCFNGLMMLIGQAIESEKLWFPDLEMDEGQLYAHFLSMF